VREEINTSEPPYLTVTRGLGAPAPRAYWCTRCATVALWSRMSSTGAAQRRISELDRDNLRCGLGQLPDRTAPVAAWTAVSRMPAAEFDRDRRSEGNARYRAPACRTARQARRRAGRRLPGRTRQTTARRQLAKVSYASNPSTNDNCCRLTQPPVCCSGGRCSGDRQANGSKGSMERRASDSRGLHEENCSGRG